MQLIHYKEDEENGQQHSIKRGFCLSSSQEHNRQWYEAGSERKNQLQNIYYEQKRENEQQQSLDTSGENELTDATRGVSIYGEGNSIDQHKSNKDNTG